MIPVPSRIKQKWRGKHGEPLRFDIAEALSTAKIDAEEFTKCWRSVHPNITENELFGLFEKGFGPDSDLSDKVEFVKDMWRRYKSIQDANIAVYGRGGRRNKGRRIRATLKLPRPIRKRWRKKHGKGYFNIFKALFTAKIRKTEFTKCWQSVHHKIPRNELFGLFEKGFGPDSDLSNKVEFVKDMWRRYKAMGEPVCTCLAFHSGCCRYILWFHVRLLSCVRGASSLLCIIYHICSRHDDSNWCIADFIIINNAKAYC